ncbi:MAG: YkuS family protein [Mycobacterium leprae]
MSKRVAVEAGLDTYKEALQNAGFEIAELRQGSMPEVDAAVISGMSRNLMGICDTDGNKFPVIEATGRSAQEVIQQIRDRLAHE